MRVVAKAILGCFSLFLRFSLARRIPLLPLTRESAVVGVTVVVLWSGEEIAALHSLEKVAPPSPLSLSYFCSGFGQGSYEFAAATTRCLRTEAKK